MMTDLARRLAEAAGPDHPDLDAFAARLATDDALMALAADDLDAAVAQVVRDAVAWLHAAAAVIARARTEQAA